MSSHESLQGPGPHAGSFHCCSCFGTLPLSPRATLLTSSICLPAISAPNISKQLFLKPFHDRVTGYKPGTGTGTASRAVGEARGQEKPIIIYLPDYPNMLVSTVLAGDVRTEEGTESRRGTIASRPRLVEQGGSQSHL
jgi:hypothetical protein